MPKRLSTERDPNESAFDLIQRVIAKTEAPAQMEPARVIQMPTRTRKNPAAVALGRKGGLKSAEARMKKIAPAERHRIASEAARARWDKQKGNG